MGYIKIESINLTPTKDKITEVCRWLPIPFPSGTPPDRIMILFDNGQTEKWTKRKWPFAVATHYCILPEPPKI